ncbi:MAG: LysR family transcriptional regulator [Pseudomonadota bacterium]
MEFRQVRYFLAVCDHMSFTRAAEACSVSQPALSVAIQKLEDELGGPLFLREGRGLLLTELGKAMRTHLGRLEETRQVAKRAARSIVDREMEMIDVGVMCTVGSRRIGRAIARWSQASGGVELLLHDVWGERAQELLLSGVLDCAIIGRTAPLSDRFLSTPLFDEPFKLVMASGHPLASASSLTMASLDGRAYVDRLRCEFRETFFDVLADRKLEVDLVMRSEREDWIQTAIAAGHGVTIAPCEMLLSEGVVARPIEDLQVSRHVEIVTVRGRPRSAPLERFLAFLGDFDWSNPTEQTPIEPTQTEQPPG